MNSKPSRSRRWIVLLAIVAYLALVAGATLGPPSIASGVFDAVVRMTGGALNPMYLEFAANTAMFVPLGFLFVLFLGPRHWAWALVVGALLTLGIEGVQGVIPGRVPDVRDLIANGSGTLVGAVLGFIAVQPRRRLLRSLAIGGALLIGCGIAAHWSNRNAAEWLHSTAAEVPAATGTLLPVV